MSQTHHQPGLSVVLVSYNTRELLRQCLESIRRHEPEAQVIVVDNGSRDDSPDMITTNFPEVTLIQMGWNAGFAAANNAGMAQSVGKTVVLLNSDTVLEDDTLSRATEWLKTRPEVGATSPKLMGNDGRPQECLYEFPSLRGLLRNAMRLPQSPPTSKARWLAGTALTIRREALESIDNKLDDQFWMYWEDADLSARLLAKAWKVEAFEGGQIIHHGGASGGGADANRRADLQAWYVYGKHRWFTKHRSIAVASAVWLLDFLDVARMWGRSLIRADQRNARVYASVTARVLLDRLRGLRPPVPGGLPSDQARSQTAPSPVVIQSRVIPSSVNP